ncbi:MAG: hypothetical protein HOV68_17720 [Streptomycetaceae bacterium]|nr:hypothetical protein [Streptomycetaceae bacterium]
MTQTPRVGRCQHCKQLRPLFHHEGELHYWGYDPGDAAWLCAPDYSARETAIDNDQAFSVFHAVEPFADSDGTR